MSYIVEFVVSPGYIKYEIVPPSLHRGIAITSVFIPGVRIP